MVFQRKLLQTLSISFYIPFKKSPFRWNHESSPVPVTVSAIHHKDQPRGAFKVLPPLWAKLLLPLASQVQHSDGGVLVLQGFHLKAFKWRARRLEVEVGDHPDKRRSGVFHGAMNFGNEKHQTSPNETRMIVALLWLWKPNVQKSKRNSLKAPSPSSYHLPQLQLLQNSALSCRFQPHHEHFHLRWAVDFVAHPGQAIPELRDSISHGSHHGRSRWQSTTLASFPKKKTSKKSQVTSLVLFFHHTSSNAALVFLEIGKMVPQNLKKWLRSMFIHSEVAAG